MGIIYKVTNDINDKVYIGQTVHTLDYRWKQHCKQSTNIDRCCKFQFAIQKYGIEHFHPELVEKDVPNELLHEREIYYIKLYNSFHNGYNATLGGEGYTKFDRNSIMQLWNEGLTCSDIANKLGCQYMTVSYALNGLKITAEDINRRSAEVRKIKNGTPIECYDLSGNLVKVYEYSSAVIDDGFDRDEVNRCCKHNHAFTHKGYYWRKVTDELSIEDIINLNTHKFDNSHNKQMIARKDREYFETIYNYCQTHSILEASTQFKRCHNSIRYAIKRYEIKYKEHNN